MTGASTTTEMTPNAKPGVTPVIGNPNPVTLVRTVVTKKTAVHFSRRSFAIIPNKTTNPDRIAARLKAT